MRITLCGSTRFQNEFEIVNSYLSLEGHVVYSCAIWGHAAGVTLSDDDKLRLDAVHMAKILNSDAIFVINKDDYIGESTLREIYLALATDKEIYFLEPEGDNAINSVRAGVELEPAGGST